MSPDEQLEQLESDFASVIHRLQEAYNAECGLRLTERDTEVLLEAFQALAVWVAPDEG